MRYLRRMITDGLTRRTLLLTLALLCGNVGSARADGNDDDDDNGDHYRAGRAVQQGQARPLAEILTAIRSRVGGEVIGVEFKRKDGRYVYKLKVVTPAGWLHELSVDAATGAIVKREEDD